MFARAPLLAELERDAHHLLLAMVARGLSEYDPEAIAARVLSARREVTATMRDEMLDPLASIVAKQIDLLSQR